MLTSESRGLLCFCSLVLRHQRPLRPEVPLGRAVRPSPTSAGPSGCDPGELQRRGQPGGADWFFSRLSRPRSTMRLSRSSVPRRPDSLSTANRSLMISSASALLSEIFLAAYFTDRRQPAACRAGFAAAAAYVDAKTPGQLPRSVDGAVVARGSGDSPGNPACSGKGELFPRSG